MIMSSSPLQTRVMVTNSLTFVDKVDLIVVLDKGCISECGTFSELLHRQGPFTEFLQEHLRKKTERDESNTSCDEEDSDDEIDKEVRRKYHYCDVIMSAVASKITSLAIVYTTVYSGTDKKTIKVPRHWPSWGDFTGDRWIPHTKGQ